MKFKEWLEKNIEKRDLVFIAKYNSSSAIPGLIHQYQILGFYDKFKDEIWSCLLEELEHNQNIFELLATLNNAGYTVDDITFKDIIVKFAIELKAKQIIEEDDLKERR